MSGSHMRLADKGTATKRQWHIRACLLGMTLADLVDTGIVHPEERLAAAARTGKLMVSRGMCTQEELDDAIS